MKNIHAVTFTGTFVASMFLASASVLLLPASASADNAGSEVSREMASELAQRQTSPPSMPDNAPRLPQRTLERSRRVWQDSQLCDATFSDHISFSQLINLAQSSDSVASSCSGGDTEAVWICWHPQTSSTPMTAIWISDWDPSTGRGPRRTDPTLQAFVRNSSGGLESLGGCARGVGDGGNTNTLLRPSSELEQHSVIYFRLGSTGNYNGQVRLELEPVQN